MSSLTVTYLIRPRTDRQFHEWIKNFFGWHYPDVAVCEDRGHVSPFEFFARAFFEDFAAGANVGPRGGGKTLGFSILHMANSLFKHGCWTCHVGAIERQAQRCRDYIDMYRRQWPWRLIIEPHGSEVRSFINGSKIEILPGCLPPWQRVITPDGPKRIAEIVSKKLPGPVKTFNFETHQWEWRQIVGWYNNGRTDEWVRGRLDPGQRGPADFTLTAGHEVVLPSGHKVPIGTLRRGETVCVPGPVLSNDQQQVLLGLMLGDGNIARHAGVLRVEHARWQDDYTRWIADTFAEFTPRLRPRDSHKTLVLETAAALPFRLARQRWYCTGTKRAPAGAFASLDRLGLAVWVMDDGGYTVTNSGSPVWTIFAMSFNRRERSEASAAFERFGIAGSWVRVKGRQYAWRCTRQGTEQLTRLIAPWVDVSVKGPRRQGWKRWVGRPLAQHSHEGLVRVKLGRLQRVHRPAYRYDITVDETHNFALASGLLVGNTMNAVSGPRPAKATFDEVEFWSWEIFQQAANMITSQPDIPGQLLLTSTRQKLHGTMNRIVEQAARTKMRTTIWCIYEVMQRCPIGADPTRKGKGCALFESKDPETGLGRCQMRNSHGDVVFRCQHDAGHIAYNDIIRDFATNDIETWETQKECKRPTRKGLVYTMWDVKRHVSEALAAYNRAQPIILGIDWGYTAPCVVGFYQTRGEVLYRFDELVLQGKLISEILEAIERKLHEYPNARLDWIAADASSPADCQEVRRKFKVPVNAYDKKKGHEIEKKHYGPIAEGIAECRRLLRDARNQTWYFVHPKCGFHVREFDLYHYEEESITPDGEIIYGDTPADEDDHCLAGDTYVETADGAVRIADLVGREPWVWTYRDTRTPVLRQAFNVRCTRRDTPVVTVSFDRGLPITCTPDHLFMTTKGYWAQARQLRPGDTIRALTLRRHPDGVLYVKTSRTPSHFEAAARIAWESVHGTLDPTYVVEHKNGDTFNVNPDNLVAYSQAEMRERYRDRVEQATQRALERRRKRRRRRGYTPDIAFCTICRKLYERETPTQNVCSSRCSKRVRADVTWRFVVNKRVTGVVDAGTADVYNMHVPETENFIANDICVHNSMDEWRYVATQLKRRRRSGNVHAAFERPQIRTIEVVPATSLIEPRFGVKNKGF